ncbi:hypothetical protein N8I77_009429 [Diaporthe amygdali]|uniref:DUF676 domain-containing protein n=1 Tax=Phomopsis amygdali TaxID=1214568 RepID=A0AAD9S9S1_PHOAM|nr:hypothetical protein N8I77_009429 [Diaporthe amygdali]
MATADVDHRPVAGDPGQVVVELSNIPQINLQSDSPDLSRSASFQLNPGSGPRSHEGSSTPTTGGLLAPEATQDGQFRKPRFVARDGAIGGKSHNETNVDVVLVPCPEADPHETWMREPLARDFFRRLPTLHHSKVAKWNEQKAITKLTAITPLSPGLNKDTKSTASWARSGIRNEANTARVLTYDHGDLTESRSLKTMADDLLRTLCTETAGKIARRPFFFICHSIGGLVVKLALTQASRSARYRPILEDCYGVTFFATPHRGSSYLSIGDFGMSIQQLLHLPRPLTAKLRGELTPDHPPLLKIDDDFKQLSSEFQVWSFHETEDSELSRIGITGLTDIPFKAPITSMRSAILGVRHEKVYALQSSHANCASFGMKNAQTLKLYLLDLGIAIQKAESLNQNTTHVPLRLEQRVMIEVHGFYETGLANEAPGDTSVRLFSTKDHSLEAFWEEGPDGLLEKRLNDIRSESQHDPQDTQFVGQKGRAQSLLSPAKALTGGEEARKKTRRPSVTVVSSGSSSTPADQKSTGSPKRNSLILEPTASRAANGGDGPPDSQSSPGRGSVRNGSLPQENTGHTAPGLTLPRHEDEISSMSRSTTGSETLVSQMSFGAAYVRPQPIRRGSSQRTVRQYLRPTSPTGRERRGSETTFIQDMRVVSAVSKPSSKTRKFVWIHTPFNNPVWVKKVFDTISLKDRQDYSELFSSENWTSRHERGRHAQHHACFLKPACGYVSLKAKQPSMLFGQTAASGRGLQRNDSSSPRQGCLYLYFPFLHFDSYKMLVKRRDIIKRRAAQGRTRPVPPEVAKDISLESRVIWEYLGYDPPFNCRRTLDQYRYPSLHDTRARDDDQMLYKMTKERVILNAKPAVASLGPVLRGDERVLTQYDRGDAAGFGDDDDDDQEHLDSESESNEDELDAKPEDDVLDGNVLMVDQLWLWAADTKTLVTFYPSREGSPMEGPLHQQADLRDSVFNEINDELPRPCENALDLAALTVLYAVSALMDRSSHPDLEIFRIFEEAISVLTEKMTSSLKRFRTTGFRNRYGEEDDLKLNSSSIRARHKREDEKAEKENRDNTSALLELRDIEDELSTLNHLFGEQEDQINQMLAIYSGSSTVSSPPTSPPPPSVWGNPVNSPPENNSTGTFPLFGTPLTNNGRVYLQEALNKLKSYRAQAKDMILRVQATRHDFDKLLETVQRQAQIDEVRLSRQQADLASAQNRSVMIFTVFTVIFLPLSFFTSLFGMNTHEWGGGNNIRLRTIGSIALPASALLIIMALFVAWSTSVRKAFKSLSKRIRRTKNRARRWWKKQMAAFWKKNENRPRTRIGRLKMHRKREALEVKRQKNRMKREMTMHDFWERHQLDRETKYEIPSRNRKSISLARAKAKARKEEKERRG